MGVRSRGGEPVMKAVVTGASRGFGRAVAAALVAEGYEVVGIARDPEVLREAAEAVGFTAVVGDATGEGLAEEVIGRHEPRLIVLNAGAMPHLAPIHEQTWETFERNWQADTRHAFTWVRAALREPLAPGSTVIAMSSGAVQAGSPLSGGYAAANAAIQYLARYATREAGRARLGIRFVTVFPQLTPHTRLGSTAVDAYAAAQGIDRETFVANAEPVLTPDLLAKAVAGLAADPDAAGEYRVGGDGVRSLG
ncbi:MAG: SDR family oxidoreductase [Nonomuraea sp.]|nr:SDR family oxidoreductase [Nonomuraea sp.]